MWQLVRRGEMPPAEAPTGPLTQQQKELIRAWIAAGAPADLSSPASHQGIPSTPSADNPLRSLGAFHLVAVHFPIAFLIAAAGTELWCALNGSRIPAPAVRFCILFSAGRRGNHGVVRLDSRGKWVWARLAADASPASLDRHGGSSLGGWHCAPLRAGGAARYAQPMVPRLAFHGGDPRRDGGSSRRNPGSWGRFSQRRITWYQFEANPLEGETNNG